MVENGIVKKAQCGDQEAISEIFEKYKKFILVRNKSYFLNGADKEDLLQEGMIGLLKAIRAYDEDKNTSFNTFASLCIKRQIITAIKNYNSGKNRILNLATNGFYEGEENNISYEKKSLNFYTPEEIFLGKEKLEALNEYLKNNLSKMEQEIFQEMLLGINYIEIATKTERDIKSIDNTIQRIKKKLKGFISEYELGKKIEVGL
ncbi:MAG: sigma-70 family RNA polymerase sigma factor [Cetobacterium sp.]|uniref:sigma-70 family RNA polymerase sigma factor n=1 Tax=unclassified Cetobacterium TaxID=2630983 RepID=UPI00163C6216|nr:sigma-70 family RNA polymerase sigma factor [Cetobacterium sp. 2A]MBC2856573.1 sigma-70 family RNA polymerase sigma factor [Cetobacterium sp. 2A]